VSSELGRTLTARGKRGAPFAAGVVAGLLVAGLLVPFVRGHGTTVVTGGASASPANALDQGSAAAINGQAGGTAGDGTPDPRSGTSSAAGAGSQSRTAGGTERASAESRGQKAGGGLETGIRADGIHVGVLIIDLGGVTKVGFSGGVDGLDPASQERWYNVFFKEINDAGGIGGRKAIPDYAVYDPTNTETQRAACLKLTDEAKVFVALENTGGYRGPDLRCFTEEHRTPYVSEFDRYNVDEIRRSGPYLVGYGMSAARGVANAAYEAERLGKLKGKKIGIIESERPGDKETDDVGLVASLQKLGHPVVSRYVFSEDLNTAATQAPLAVHQLQAAGVDVLFANTNVLTSTQFVNAAAGQVYRPQYITSDWYGLGTDFGAQEMPASFDGALAFVAERDGEYNSPGRAEPAIDKNCRETVQKANGENYDLKSNQNAVIVQTCGVVRLFAQIARATVSNLTRDGFAAAMQRLGRVDPPRMAPGFFAPGRYDAASQVRSKTWSVGCTCWKITEEFHDSRV
jgi:ABC-type branched-subunit amino acid transport system substrate-binding protein